LFLACLAGPGLERVALEENSGAALPKISGRNLFIGGLFFLSESCDLFANLVQAGDLVDQKCKARGR
jgi:hypothetical protein